MRACSDVSKIRDMKHTICTITALFILWGTPLSAQIPKNEKSENLARTSRNTSNKNIDSTDKNPQIETMENVIIRIFTIGDNNPNSNFETIKGKDLELRNLGQDIPMLLQHQTGIVSTSDAGNGVGYTGIRVRGSDATRTHISVNGVPINDAESQGTFWVNMPDLASSAQNIHIQRGVGSSVHGAGAFGGSVMIQTGSNINNSASVDLSYGAFNTRKLTAKYTGPELNWGGREWKFDFRFSHIGSDGFIDRGASDMYGYMASASSTGKKWNKWNYKIISFGGVQKTYQAWWGIPIEKYRLGQSNPSGKDSQALNDHYNRNIGMYRNAQDSANLFQSNPKTYNYYIYPNEIDHYQQHHLHYYLSKNINTNSNFNSTLYYTFGQGYFEQFRFQDALEYYGLPLRSINGDTTNSGNLIRRRWLQNHLIGINSHFNYLYSNTLKLQAGVGASRYLGQHFGNVIGVGDANNDVKNLQLNPQYEPELPVEYYRSSGNKTDINAFIKALYDTESGIHAFADAQIRYVRHSGKGTDNDLLNIDFLGEFLFFNPKVGIQYIKEHELGTSNLQASASVAHREPARSDFVDNPSQNIPKPERLIDYELGYQFQFQNKGVWNINGYYLDYYNQLVLTGALNDVGTPLRQNVARSFRRGIEISGTQPIWHNTTHTLSFIGNAAFSQNRIQESPASWIDYADYSVFDTIYKNAPIAYAPDIVASAGIRYEFRKNQQRYELQYLHKYVSQQFLDNTGDATRSLPAYDFSELQMAWSRAFQGKKSIKIKLLVQNLWNNSYLNNGYTWGYMYQRQLTQEVFVFPSAPFNASVAVSLTW